MFYGIPDLTTFVIGTIFIVLLPGPNSLYVVALASAPGHHRGVSRRVRHLRRRRDPDAALGDRRRLAVAIVAGAIPWAIKFAGAAYLAWIGFCLLPKACAAGIDRAAGGAATPGLPRLRRRRAPSARRW